VLGFSWKPPEDERKIVRNLIIYLEDRRALTVERHHGNLKYVIDSLQDIRDAVTKTLQELPEKSKGNDQLQRIRAACSAFMTTMETVGTAGPEAFVELGTLRALCGREIAQLSFDYQIDIGEHLATILPPKLKTTPR
jgi:hypothetical protein